jgi:hypothetical protein
MCKIYCRVFPVMAITLPSKPGLPYSCIEPDSPFWKNIYMYALRKTREIGISVIETKNGYAATMSGLSVISFGVMPWHCDWAYSKIPAVILK